MKSRIETCARVAEIAGAIAVVISVIYLAIQITENSKLLRSQAHYNALALGQRPLELMVENESLAGVVALCDADPQNVPAVAWERCLNYYFMELNAWEYMYYQNLDGSIPHEFWVGSDAYFKLLIVTKPAYRRAWREVEATFDDPFRSYANEEFRKGANAAKTPPQA